MNQIFHIISSFSQEEQQKFELFLTRRNKRKDTKNIQLFKLLKQQESSTELICNVLYGKQNRAALYTLKQRLHESLIDFIAMNKIQGENSIDMLLIKYIMVARDFLFQQNYNEAYKLLNKAKVLAKDYELFPILNEIYHTKIQYAHLHPKTDLNKIILEFKSNQKSYFLEEELNIIYAKIRNNLILIPSEKGAVSDFESFIYSIFKEHDINIDDSLSFKSLYQLISIVNISAFIHKNYLKVEPFLIKTYSLLVSKKRKEKQLFYHIRVLYLIANTLFRNKKFKESLNYLESMLSLMHENNKKYFKLFTLNHLLLLSLNKNYMNQQEEAIKLLEDTIRKKHTDQKSLLEIQLSLLMFYFQSSEFDKAIKLLYKLNHSDQWYNDKVGVEWVIKKNLFEILLHLELENLNLFESRLLSFKRKYYPYLKEINQDRVIEYLRLVEVYYKDPSIVTTTKFHDLVESSFEFIGPKQEDIFVMSFYAWLKSKMQQSPVFEVTLELVKQAQHSSI
ncbi:hypothetical protein [Tenacibaculum xiamenense]|uniref:hypothetical protein n=1 Tax=Tenacibaculum xiamenense TaxID=1261553 RepID=UPI003894786D